MQADTGDGDVEGVPEGQGRCDIAAGILAPDVVRPDTVVDAAILGHGQFLAEGIGIAQAQDGADARAGLQRHKVRQRLMRDDLDTARGHVFRGSEGTDTENMVGMKMRIDHGDHGLVGDLAEGFQHPAALDLTLVGVNDDDAVIPDDHGGAAQAVAIGQVDLVGDIIDFGRHDARMLDQAIRDDRGIFIIHRTHGIGRHGMLLWVEGLCPFVARHVPIYNILK